MLQDFMYWARETPLADFVMGRGFIWPILESFHYVGLALLFATVAIYDLRILGLAKAAPPSALHKLVPFGVAGFLINLTTGTMFFVTQPEQYIFNAAFKTKLVLLVIAGANVALFYSWVFAGVRDLGAGADAPWRAKLVTGVSLAAWIGVMIAGRLITFHRP
jgi:hypothetical protein